MPRLRESRIVYDEESGAKLFSAEEAARYLKYHPVSFRRLVSRGDIHPHTKVGIALLFLREELDRFKYESPWASKKARVRFIPNPPPMPTTKKDMMAVVTVEVERRNRLFKRLSAFHWDEIPAIRAAVDRRFGKVPFHITIESPDGCGFELNFHPSVMEADHYDKLRGRKKGGTPWLVG